MLTILISSCQDKVKTLNSVEVKNFGELRTIMSGDLQSVFSLDSLSTKKNVYALGAFENLKGEIQIFNSQPSNSVIIDGSLQNGDAYHLNAALLVYAEVEDWEAYQLENSRTKDELESAIFEIAKNSAVDTGKPFPFLLEGKVASLDWHVINWKDGDTIHSHEKHKESGLNGTLVNKKVQIIGFFSTKHKAVFTHHTTNMHMHFKTDDNTIAGHIDDLQIENKLILKLPKQ